MNGTKISTLFTESEMNIDTTKPNAGRIYDYLLGGDHNFEADRIAADQLTQFIPILPTWLRLNRLFLFLAVDQLVAAGFNHYIDLATGIPTQGYLHDRLPETARIIYNDIDPATVADARQMLSGRHNIRYVQSDLREIDHVLQEAEAFFGNASSLNGGDPRTRLAPERRVGICMVGVAYFIDDESLARTLQRLYTWAAPGTKLAISFMTSEEPIPNTDPVMSMYRQIGAPIYMRTKAEVLQLTAPWQPCTGGLQYLESMFQEQMSVPININPTIARELMMGGIFEKPVA